VPGGAPTHHACQCAGKRAARRRASSWIAVDTRPQHLWATYERPSGRTRELWFMLCASPPTRRRDRFRPLEDRSRRSALAKRRRREITTGAACGQPQQRACRLCLHNRIAKGQVRIDSISIAAPATLTTHVARLLQIAEHTVRIALGNFRSFCNLPDPQVRVSSNNKQHVRMTGDERPPSCRELLECTPLPRYHRAELLAASQLPLNHQTVEREPCFLL
jgi:hypothetical protein